MMTSTVSRIKAQPGLLRRFNLGATVRRLQISGPLSRAELARATDISYPTVMKICDTLTENRLIEEGDVQRPALGRPGQSLRMATESAQVISVSLGPEQIRAGVAGLDGTLVEETRSEIPETYAELLKAIESLVGRLKRTRRARTLGLGVAVPGLIDTGEQRVIVSPNVPTLKGRLLSRDLQVQTRLRAVVVRTMRAQLLAERIRGRAVGLDNFALLNYRGGLGVAVATNGRFVEGTAGLAGELGHIVVDPTGERCGCGHRGCLETIATDVALAKAVSRKLRRSVSVEQLMKILRNNPEQITAEVDRAVDYLAMGIGVVINLFNPQAVFLFGRFAEADDDIFSRLIHRVGNSALKELARNCTIAPTQCDTLEGAALAVVDDLVDRLCVP